MTNKTNALKEAIDLLENKQKHELRLLREQLHVTYQSLKPINLIKSTFNEVSASPEVKDNILSNVIGLTTGYLSKKVLLGTTRNPITKLLGTVFQFTVSNFVAKNADTIKALGGMALNSIFKKKEIQSSQITHKRIQ